MLAKRGFQLFRIFGFNVTADWSWLAIFALMSLSLATGFICKLKLEIEKHDF